MKHLLLLSILLFGFTSDGIYKYKNVEVPCGKKDSGVNIRIVNNGNFAFTNFYLVVKGNKYHFGGCLPGEASCYKNILFIYSDNSYDIEFKYDPDGKETINSIHTKLQIGADPKKPNPKIKSGSYTLNIKLQGSISKPESPLLSLEAEK